MFKPFSRYQDKTWRIVATLITLIIVLEVLSEEVVSRFDIQKYGGLAEGIALAILLSPALYVLVVRPLILQIKEREQAREDLQKTHDELQKAISEKRELEKILPICSYCKKIRDEKQIWSPIDEYVRMHTDTDFSHGICPDCKNEHFPGYP